MVMEARTTENEKTYTSGEIAVMIGIGATTARKYALHLEKNGYHFHRTSSNARLFTATDIMAVRYLKELRQKTNITVEQAAAIVCEKFQHKEHNESSEVQVMETNANIQDYHELKELVSQQNELLENLVQLLNRQQQYIDEQLTIRDRSLMHAINEKLQAQKLAAATEKTPVAEKQSIFSKVFKKGS